MKYPNRIAALRWPERFAGRMISTSLVVGLAAWSLAHDTQMTPLAGSVHRTIKFGTQVPIDSSQIIQIGVVFNVDTAGLQAFVDQVSDPASPSYRQFLSPEE